MSVTGARRYGFAVTGRTLRLTLPTFPHHFLHLRSPGLTETTALLDTVRRHDARSPKPQRAITLTAALSATELTGQTSRAGIAFAVR